MTCLYILYICYLLVYFHYAPILEDYNKKNVFDIEEYIKRKGKVKLNRNTVITRLQDLLL
ncbi:hypothetical protein CJI53_02820 [Bifidobacteriaceae bacterium VN002]|nr:hypothetical protein CG395_03905 [Bifidobacteriaceae bacterium GH022]RIY22085.1 hypothetical protein CJI53_02820 [Bifidobacteriaceae bacterium VN002]